MHRIGLAQNTWAGLDVHQGVVHVPAAEDSGDVTTKVHRLMDHKPLLNHWRCLHRVHRSARCKGLTLDTRDTSHQ